MEKIDFTTIDYLKHGNERQRQAYKQLNELGIFEALKVYNPLLTGTIPIEIDLPESDLDIICECVDHETFAKDLVSLYSHETAFSIRTHVWNGLTSTIASFRYGEFEFEIFGQNCPTQLQNAYRHMIIEHRILQERDEAFRTNIIRLKQEGMKTEPAFAQLLGLEGDPYATLLTFYDDIT